MCAPHAYLPVEVALHGMLHIQSSYIICRFINLASPILLIPFRPFIISAAIGLQPINFMIAEAGQQLSKMHSNSDLWSTKNVLMLIACALIALLPMLVARCTSRSKLKLRRTISRRVSGHVPVEK